MAKKAEVVKRLDPDQRPLTKIQASRLAAVAGVDQNDLVGATVIDLSEKFKWIIDPNLLFFRRVCGRVVKTINGVQYPVPHATVHVEDTDLNLLGYFPPNWPWGWYYPFWSHREEIATAEIA